MVPENPRQQEDGLGPTILQISAREAELHPKYPRCKGIREVASFFLSSFCSTGRCSRRRFNGMMIAESNVTSSKALESLEIRRPALGSSWIYLWPCRISPQAGPLSTEGS